MAQNGFDGLERISTQTLLDVLEVLRSSCSVGRMLGRGACRSGGAVECRVITR